MKTDRHFGSFLGQFLFEGEMFQEKVVEKNHNTHFMFHDSFPENRVDY